MYYTRTKAFAMLEIMLATMLLVGLIFLIMHTISNYHRSSADATLGSELSPLISDVLENIETDDKDYSGLLIQDKSTKVCASNTSGFLTDISRGYLSSMEQSNFSLCSATIDIKQV